MLSLREFRYSENNGEFIAALLIWAIVITSPLILLYVIYAYLMLKFRAEIATFKHQQILWNQFFMVSIIFFFELFPFFMGFFYLASFLNFIIVISVLGAINVPFFFYASTMFCLFDMILAIQRLVMIFGDPKHFFLVTGTYLKYYVSVVWLTLPLFYVFKLEKRKFEKFILLQAMPMTIIRTIREIAILVIAIGRVLKMEMFCLPIAGEQYRVLCYAYYLHIPTLAFVVPLSFILNRNNYSRVIRMIKNQI
ncbi:unnamed protein product [Caenorhabditis auriculariae]|uniref:Uncharacterized protein n=1 Tax=Caenorhabditis auriculariae TaxID=2777116 RepID=A0A8S1HZ73_9PELO|nr:unnamed protein product [Caenorhabditis auriculariae]